MPRKKPLIFETDYLVIEYSKLSLVKKLNTMSYGGEAVLGNTCAIGKLVNKSNECKKHSRTAIFLSMWHRNDRLNTQLI